MLEIDIDARRGSFALSARLDVPPGVTALTGASGAGKSSLLRIVAGLDRPERGTVRLGGRVLNATPDDVFVRPEKRNIGMVFQRPALVPHLSVPDNITLGSRKTIPQALLERTGCGPLLGKPVAALSGGEQQRVMLARALLGDPHLLLFDEPLSALDDAASAGLLALLAELVPTLGIPVLYVTHDLEEAGVIAERFAMMERGSIVAVGSSAEILAAYGTRPEHGISGLLPGVVESVAEDGLARVRVAGGVAEIAGEGLAAGDMVALRLWARDIILARAVPQGLSARNALAGRIGALRPVPGGQVEVGIVLGEAVIPAIVMARTVKEMGLAEGQAIHAVFKSASVAQTSRLKD